ncbi:MAG: hypothetical protein PUD51_04485 [Prevotellaceae bacterium]|nr:hypothetical protein [Prevotellaceae bacterium]
MLNTYNAAQPELPEGAIVVATSGTTDITVDDGDGHETTIKGNKYSAQATTTSALHTTTHSLLVYNCRRH